MVISGGGRRMVRSRTRDEILSVAARLFTRAGFKGTSLNDIAVEVGCSKATLLYHFDGKDAILVDLVAPAVEHVRQLDGRLGTLPDDEARAAAIEGFVDLVIAYRMPVALIYADPQLLDMPAFADLRPAVDRLVAAFAGRSTDRMETIAAAVVLAGTCQVATAHGDDTDLRAALVRVATRALTPSEGL
jgi:AcrR family transcriptional regulator